MNREDILKDIIKLKGKNFLLELPTGTGKTKIALEKVKSLKVKKILIVISRLVQESVWREEINKWYKENNLNITFTTYLSLHKHIGKYDLLLFDEAHHLSERCRELIPQFKYKYSILLSATIPNSLKYDLQILFAPLSIYKKTLRATINNNILPDPIVYLIPMELDNTISSEIIIKNNKVVGKGIHCLYKDRWPNLRNHKKTYIHCTPKEYLYERDLEIDYWKKKYFNTRNEGIKNKWLYLCGKRLKYLSDKKTPFIKKVLNLIYQHKLRSITFCNSINQAKELGKYCITSNNSKSSEYLEAFNNKKISNITSCNMLNESVNLTDCKIGIFASINSSDVLIKQKNGRVLRHKEPIIIIPYYKNTREEELVNKMTENYNPQLIKIINNLKELKL